MSIRTRLTALLVTSPLVLAGCSGAQSTPAPAGTNAPGAPTAAATPTGTPQPGDEVDPSTFFGRTQKAMLDAKTYAMTMKMTSGSQVITMTGHGDVSDQNHPKADMVMTSPAGEGQMHMIMDGQSIYMQMPGATTGGKFVQMPISALSQAGGQDLTKLMNPAENLELTRSAVEKVVYRGMEDKGGEKLAHYALTMNPRKLQQSLASGAPTPPNATVPSSLPYDVWIDDAGRVRLMTMNVDGTTMTMTTDEYGKPVSITAPPQASVTQMPGLSGPASSAPVTPGTPAPASPAPGTAG